MRLLEVTALDKLKRLEGTAAGRGDSRRANGLLSNSVVSLFPSDYG